MENLAFYLVLLLGGIILGGMAVLSLTGRPITSPYYPNADYVRHTGGSFWYGLIFLILVFAGLWMYKEQSLMPNFKGETPPVEQQSPYRLYASVNGLGKSPTVKSVPDNEEKYYFQFCAFIEEAGAQRHSYRLRQDSDFPIYIYEAANEYAPYKIVTGPFPKASSVTQFAQKNNLSGFTVRIKDHASLWQ